jgi:hypothetical protein
VSVCGWLWLNEDTARWLILCFNTGVLLRLMGEGL